MDKKTALIFLAIASISGLVFAYISQFVFGHEPCNLCLYQRKPFFAIIFLVLFCFTFLKSKKSQQLTFLLCITLLLINCGIALFHVGVEQKIFHLPEACSSDGLNNLNNLEELQAALMKTKSVRCDQPTFFFLGITMAAWNFVFCASLIMLTTILHSPFQALLNFCKHHLNSRLTKN